MVTRERGCVCSTARAAGRELGVDKRAVGVTEAKGMGLERSEDGLLRLEEEEEEEEEQEEEEEVALLVRTVECTVS